MKIGRRIEKSGHEKIEIVPWRYEEPGGNKIFKRRNLVDKFFVEKFSSESVVQIKFVSSDPERVRNEFVVKRNTVAKQSVLSIKMKSPTRLNAKQKIPLLVDFTLRYFAKNDSYSSSNAS